ncbi:MAG: class I SAM-dependent methyltransferase [Polyangiales bacterium]
MRNAFGMVLVSFVVGCGANPPPEATEAKKPEPVASATSTPSASASAVASVEPPKAPEPTPEEKAKAEAKKQLQNDRDKMAADQKAEIARWTPELHAEAKKLADTSYPTGKAAILAAMAGKHRRPGNAERDKYRHPVEMMEFFGFKPTMTVLEFGPGAGWFTELLAPALAKKGKLMVTSTDPNGPKEERSSFYGERFKLFMETAPELYGKIEVVLIEDANPKLGHEGQVDMVLSFRGLHGMVNNGKLDAWLAQMNAVLKNGGVLAIEEHRAKPGADPIASAKKGYLPEAFVIEKVEAAGFKLAGKSEIGANPKDTTDWPEGVWTLPPTLRLGDKDKDKYMAIGESDRMTLKFVKVPPKKK